jgi:hypothetical protein
MCAPSHSDGDVEEALHNLGFPAVCVFLLLTVKQTSVQSGCESASASASARTKWLRSAVGHVGLTLRQLAY